MRFYYLKKVFNLNAFFIACLVAAFMPAGAAAAECGVKHYDQTANVARVVDGDTVVLADKQRVRLIGIDAPELAHYPKKAEAYGVAAKRYLNRQLRANKKVYLKFGRQKKDHYGRLLAHLFLSDGRNLNGMLVKQSLASAVVVPPNVALIDCYFKLEREARKKEKNIWSVASFKVVDADKIKNTGFAFIKGKVMHIGKSRGSIWLQLAPVFTLRIKRKNFKYFKNIDLKNLRLKDLKDKTLYARGWVYKWKNEFYLQIRHPKMISKF